MYIYIFTVLFVWDDARCVQQLKSSQSPLPVAATAGAASGLPGSADATATTMHAVTTLSTPEYTRVAIEVSKLQEKAAAVAWIASYGDHQRQSLCTAHRCVVLT